MSYNKVMKYEELSLKQKRKLAFHLIHDTKKRDIFNFGKIWKSIDDLLAKASHENDIKKIESLLAKESM